MSDPYDFDLVCIGSGPAGQRAAVQAAKLGRARPSSRSAAAWAASASTPGTIPSKTLREAVITFSGLAGKGDRLPWARLDDAAHLPPALRGRRHRDHPRDGGRREPASPQRRDDVSGEASFLDPHTLVIRSEAGWRQVTAEHILIAVGTHPAPTPGVKADGEVILNTDDVVRLQQLPRTLAVVGAGVIGIEYTSIFAALGVA